MLCIKLTHCTKNSCCLGCCLSGEIYQKDKPLKKLYFHEKEVPELSWEIRELHLTQHIQNCYTLADEDFDLFIIILQNVQIVYTSKQSSSKCSCSYKRRNIKHDISFKNGNKRYKLIEI